MIANEKASNHFRDMALAHLQHCETCKLLSERPIKPSPQFNAPSVQDRPMKARSPRKFIIDRESISSDAQRGCHFSCLLQKGCSQFMKEPFENFERLEFLSDGPNSPLYVDLYREIPGSSNPSTDRAASMAFYTHISMFEIHLISPRLAISQVLINFVYSRTGEPNFWPIVGIAREVSTDSSSKGCLDLISA